LFNRASGTVSTEKLRALCRMIPTVAAILLAWWMLLPSSCSCPPPPSEEHCQSFRKCSITASHSYSFAAAEQNISSVMRMWEPPLSISSCIISLVLYNAASTNTLSDVSNSYRLVKEDDEPLRDTNKACLNPISDIWSPSAQLASLQFRVNNCLRIVTQAAFEIEAFVFLQLLTNIWIWSTSCHKMKLSSVVFKKLFRKV